MYLQCSVGIQLLYLGYLTIVCTHLERQYHNILPLPCISKFLCEFSRNFHELPRLV